MTNGTRLWATAAIGVVGLGLFAWSLPDATSIPQQFAALRVAAAAEPASHFLFQSLSMASARVGWATTQGGHLLRTSDAGASWVDVTPQVEPPTQPGTVVTMTFFLPGSANIAWVLDGRTETVYRTIDGGVRWEKGSAPTLSIAPDGGVDLDFVDARHGWLIVDSGGHNEVGEIFQTNDGGMRWTMVAGSRAGTSRGLPYGGMIAFSPTVPGLGWLRPDPELGLTVPLYVTHDGGREWSPSPLSARYSHAYVNLPIFPAGGGGVTEVTTFGRSGLGSQTVFLRTGDGGLRWVAARPLPNSYGAHAFWRRAESGWVYIPAENAFYRTLDGGDRWTVIDPNLQFEKLPLDSFAFAPGGAVGWAIIAGGALAFTRDGGTVWR